MRFQWKILKEPLGELSFLKFFKKWEGYIELIIFLDLFLNLLRDFIILGIIYLYDINI